jgi:hypothetical protein
MWADFPSSINPKLKYLDRYTVWDVLRALLLTGAGWYVAESTGAAGGLILGLVLAQAKLGGKPLDQHVLETLDRVINPRKVSSPEFSRFVDGSVIFGDDTVIGMVEVSSQDIEYASDAGKEANIDTVRELLDEVDHSVKIYSRQRQVDLSTYTGATGSTVTTDHYVLVKENGSSLKRSHHKVKNRCEEVEEILTAGDLYAERLTGNQLKSAVQRLYPGKTRISGNIYRTKHGQKKSCRLLYVDEYPERLPLGWIAEILNTETPGLVDVVQTGKPVSNNQRDWMDRMLARTDSELFSSRKPSRQADLRQQKQDLEDLIDVEANGEKLVNYGVWIVARGDSKAEASRTLKSVKTVLKRLRIDTVEPRNLNQGFKRVSPFHSSRVNKTEIVPVRAAAIGFSFATQDAIEPGGILFGTRKNAPPVILDRFSWEAGHTTVMGKTGSGKTYWTKLMLLRLYKALDDLEIFVVDPKKRDYGELIQALDGETQLVDSLSETDNDVVRYTVEDPSKDNTEELAEAVRHVYRQAVKTDKKTLVVVDETHRIITKGDSIYQDGVQAVSTLVRESRMQNVAATLVTQNADEFVRSNEGKNILRNTDCNLFFKQRKLDNQVSNFFELSEPQRKDLRKLRTGTELGFSETLIHGPMTARLKIESTEEEHRLIEKGEKTVSVEPSVTDEDSGSDPQEAKKQKTDGGQKTKKSNSTRSKNRYGFLKLVSIVLGASIGLFEYLLLTGFPVAAVLYRKGMLKSTLQLEKLPLDGTLIDVLAVWTAIILVAEIAWVLLLSTDLWIAQDWS